MEKDCERKEVIDAQSLLAVHPEDSWVATAFGCELRVAYSQPFPSAEASSAAWEQWAHDDVIRVLCTCPHGRLLLTAGDDKRCRVWCTRRRVCLQTSTTSKKISAGCFTPDGAYVIVGDKFGDVHIVHAPASNSPDVDSVAALHPLMGHYCATITTLVVDPDQRLLASGDRDAQLRVSNLLPNPILGSWEIQSYCLGHNSAITCATFMRPGGTCLLLSGGMDGVVALWDPETGTELTSMDLAALDAGATEEGCQEHPQDAANADGGHEAMGMHGGGTPPVAEAHHSAGIVALAGHSRTIAVALQGSDDIFFLSIEERPSIGEGEREGVSECPAQVNGNPLHRDSMERPHPSMEAVHPKLATAGLCLRLCSHAPAGSVSMPTRLQFSSCGRRLWVAGGPWHQGAASFHLGCLRQQAGAVFFSLWHAIDLNVPQTLEQFASPKVHIHVHGITLTGYAVHSTKQRFSSLRLSGDKWENMELPDAFKLLDVRHSVEGDGTASPRYRRVQLSEQLHRAQYSLQERTARKRHQTLNIMSNASKRSSSGIVLNDRGCDQAAPM